LDDTLTTALLEDDELADAHRLRRLSPTSAGNGTKPLDLLDFEPKTIDFYAEVVTGLRNAAKTLPCKFFYDERGSRLFDEICDLDEYYPTRTELGIMQDWITEISVLLGGGCRLVEYGSGSSLKTRVLLDNMSRLASYVPVDISRGHLQQSARQLARDYPHIPIQPICADYTTEFGLPLAGSADDVCRTIVYFPGSTIGNFLPSEAEAFLSRIKAQCGPAGGLLIGVDLKKEQYLLNDAYNDKRGVTANFNLNLLSRINRELGADFLLNSFSHRAFYNVFQGRIEMHLVSQTAQTVRVGGEIFQFEAGETIHTECSYKYTVEEFRQLAGAAGFRVESVWTDPDDLFSVQYLAADS
jgi:dimethylhistidine N-methyltransferase